MLLLMCIDRLQTENKLLRAEADSLSQQNRQQQQGLSQVEELATMLQESHRLLYRQTHSVSELKTVIKFLFLYIQTVAIYPGLKKPPGGLNSTSILDCY